MDAKAEIMLPDQGPTTKLLDSNNNKAAVNFEYEREKDIVPRLRELLRLRHGAVLAERKQLKLLEVKNEVLRSNVDQAEAEVGSLQEALTEANEKLRLATKEKNRLDRRIASIKLTSGTVKGQEYTIDLAGKQNTKLLLLLQEEEKKQKELETENIQCKDEISILREKLSATTRDFSLIEIKLKEQTFCRDLVVQKLETAHKGLRLEHGDLKKRYDVETVFLKSKVDALTEQVDRLNGQPYALLHRLQKAEDATQRVIDEKESLEVKVKVLEEQNIELTSHLEKAIERGNAYKEKMDFLLKGVPPLEKELASLRTRLEFERHDKAGLESQVYSLSQAVTGLVQRQTTLESKATQKENELFGIIQGKDIEEKKIDQALCAKSRTILRQEKRIQDLEARLEESQKDMDQAIQEIELLAKDAQEPYLHQVQSLARQRLLDMHLQAMTALTIDEPGTDLVNEQLYRLTSLDLSHCAVTDMDLQPIFDAIALCPRIYEINLQDNLITDQACSILSTFIFGSQCYLRMMQLQGNRLTAQGLRKICLSLEKVTSLRGQSVVLSKEGIIEIFPPSNDPSIVNATASAASEKRKSGNINTARAEIGIEPMFTLDARKNLMQVK